MFGEMRDFGGSFSAFADRLRSPNNIKVCSCCTRLGVDVVVPVVCSEGRLLEGGEVDLFLSLEFEFED